MSGISVNNEEDIVSCSPAVDKLNPSLSDLASEAVVSSAAAPPPPNPWQIPPQSAGAACDRERSSSRQWVQKQQGECLKRSDSGGYFNETGFSQVSSDESICPPPTPLYDTMYKYPEIPPSKDVPNGQRCQIPGMSQPMTDGRRHSWYDEVLDTSCRKLPMNLKTECEPPRLSHYPTPYPRSACDDKLAGLQHHSEGSTGSHRPTFLPLHLSDSSEHDAGYMSYSSGMQSPYTPAFLTPSPFLTPGAQYRRDEVFNFRSPVPPFRKNSDGKFT